MSLDDLKVEALEKGELVLDIESNHADVWKSDWEMYGLGACSGSQAVYLTDYDLYRNFISWCYAQQVRLIGHNFKYDLMGMKKACNLSDYPQSIACTMVSLNLVDENLRANQVGLKYTVKRLFDYEMVEYEEAIEGGKDSTLFAEYCMDDCRQTLRLWQHLKEKMEQEELMKLFDGISMPFLKAVIDMEFFGFYWDLETAEKLLIAYKKKEIEMEEAVKTAMGKPDINLRSVKQLNEALFEDMALSTDGLEKIASGKGWKLDKVALEFLAAKYPIVQSLADYRHAADMQSKYLFKITDFALQDPNYRTHPNTWITSTTGRTRQTNPPNQTIPKYPRFFIEDADGKKDFHPYRIRNGFKAPPGKKLLVADISQFQLRLCAHISGDVEMTKAFCTWQCRSCGDSGWSETLLLNCPKCGAEPNENVIKDPLCSEGFWHGLDLHQMTCDAISVIDNRQDGKTCNFALIFLASEYRMHMEHPKFSKRQWKRIIEDFFAKYSGVRDYHHNLERLMNATGVVRDIFGRKRRISKRDIREHYKHSLNQFVNFPVQASEVHYMELCAAKLREEFISRGWWNFGYNILGDSVGLVHFMHDELVLECSEALVEEVGKLVLEKMRFLVQLNVPIDAELEVKDVW